MKYFIITLLSFVIAYACVSFIIWDFNAAFWEMKHRAAVLLIGLIFSIYACVMTYLKEDKPLDK